MRKNSTLTTYPKRSASSLRPKYKGKMLWGMHDHLIKCIDCTRYASHEATIVHEPTPFDPKEIARVSYCVKCANKALFLGIIVTVKPFEEFRAYQRELAKWESQNAPEVQGAML